MKKTVFYAGFFIVLLAAWFLLREDVYYTIARQDLTSILEDDFTSKNALIIKKRLDGPVKSLKDNYRIFTWIMALSSGDSASLSIWVHKCPLKMEFYSPRVIGNSGWTHLLANTNAELKK